MNKSASRAAKSTFVVAAVGLTTIALALGWLGRAYYRRDFRDVNSFRLVQTASAPDGKAHAFLFEHSLPKTPANEAYYEEIVSLDKSPEMTVGELMLRMKNRKTVLIAATPASKPLALFWLNDSTLQVTCTSCLESPIEMIRRVPVYGTISTQYVGFPKDTSYSSVEPMEKWMTDQKNQHPQLTGSEILWATLVGEGVDKVFGYPGGAILPAYDALRKFPIHRFKRGVFAKYANSVGSASEGAVTT